MSKYESIKDTLRKSGVTDWKLQLLNVGKDSLKNDVDKRACRHMDSLKEFEKYIESTYIAGLSLTDDLLSDILLRTEISPVGSQSVILNS